MRAPQFVVVVSTLSTAIETRLCRTVPEAVAWCAQGMLRWGDQADQVAVLGYFAVPLPRGGEQTGLSAVQGWRRNASGWHAVEPHELMVEIEDWRGEDALPRELDAHHTQRSTEALTSALTDLTVVLRGLSEALRPSRSGSN